MKIDVSKPITTVSGEAHNPPMSVRDPILSVLVNILPNDENVSADVKVRMWKLSQAVHNNDVVDISDEDRILVKQRVNVAYSALVLGQVYDALDAPVVEA